MKDNYVNDQKKEVIGYHFTLLLLQHTRIYVKIERCFSRFGENLGWYGRGNAGWEECVGGIEPVGIQFGCG